MAGKSAITTVISVRVPLEVAAEIRSTASEQGIAPNTLMLSRLSGMTPDEVTRGKWIRRVATKPIGVRFPVELLDKIKAVADTEGVSVNAVILAQVQAWFPLVEVGDTSTETSGVHP